MTYLVSLVITFLPEHCIWMLQNFFSGAENLQRFTQKRSCDWSNLRVCWMDLDNTDNIFRREKRIYLV